MREEDFNVWRLEVQRAARRRDDERFRDGEPNARIEIGVGVVERR